MRTSDPSGILGGQEESLEPRVLQHDITGQGDPLVLVPGGLTGWLSWIPHQERLNDHHRVIRVQPIHNELGSAGRPGDPGYSARVERESLRLTLDELEVDRTDLAGWSSGARALIHFAAAYPERVRSLALVEPGAYWILEEEYGELDPQLRGQMDVLAGLAGKDVSEDDLADFLVGAGLADDPGTVRHDPAWERWAEVRNALSWQGFIGEDRPTEDIGRIDCPVLLVKGTVTVSWEKQVVDLLATRLPDARVVELEGDHASHLQSIDRFLEELERHLH